MLGEKEKEARVFVWVYLVGSAAHWPSFRLQSGSCQ
jgi:hypothetical protein